MVASKSKLILNNVTNCFLAAIYAIRYAYAIPPKTWKRMKRNKINYLWWSCNGLSQSENLNWTLTERIKKICKWIEPNRMCVCVCVYVSAFFIFFFKISNLWTIIIMNVVEEAIYAELNSIESLYKSKRMPKVSETTENDCLTPVNMCKTICIPFHIYIYLFLSLSVIVKWMSPIATTASK